MLAPDERTLLSDLLAPPSADYQLERAIATTFTLDLTAILPVMLGFAGRDISESANQLSVMQAVRSFSDRVDVFCQAGMIAAPEKSNDLIELVSQMVHQVKAPNHGLFHPKVWILRFISDHDERFRFVCGSRNLTFGKSWDTAITLEGVRTRQPKKLNRPVFEWIESLLGRVPTGISQERSDAMTELAEGVRFVEWDSMPGQLMNQDSPRFHFFGDYRTARPDMSGYNRLVISPFITDGGLDIAWPKGDCTIISRQDQLDALVDPNNYLPLATVHCFNDDAALPDLESDENGPQWSLRGLHSKLYAVERGKRAHVFIGSANATGPAWTKNDELLVEFVGSTRTYGVEALVGEKAPMRKLLIDYSRGKKPDESLEAKLLERIERALCDLAAVPFDATVDHRKEGLTLTIESSDVITLPPVLGEATALTISPRTQPAVAREIAAGERASASWSIEHVEEVTPYFIINLAVEFEGVKASARTIVLARLHGDPEDRLDRIFAKHFATPDQFMQFILALLQLADVSDLSAEADSGASFGLSDAISASGWDAAGDGGLLEAILGALVDSPGSIDDIERLVQRLARTDEGRALLPEGWNDLWPQVLEARARMGDHLAA